MIGKHNTMRTLMLTVLIVIAPAVEAEWGANGVPVCTEEHEQEFPCMVPDGAGGAIIAWTDDRNISDIYVQRVDADGNVLWTADGVRITLLMRNDVNPCITSDGAGGAILAWENRQGNVANILAQRVNSSGGVMWTSGGVDVCSADYEQRDACIVADGVGGAFIAWVDERNEPFTGGDIYAQRVGASGSVLWTEDGIPVCYATGVQEAIDMAADGAGGAVLVWDDERAPYYITAQRLDSAGNKLWTANGNAIGDQLDDADPRIISDGSGGAICTWVDDGPFSAPNIYAQRVNAAGSEIWSNHNKKICQASEDQLTPLIAADGEGGAFITWTDERNGNPDVYAQHVDSLGNAYLTEDGIGICTDLAVQNVTDLTEDGSKGVVLTWEDDRPGSTYVYAQRIDSLGGTVWADDGLALSTAWPVAMFAPQVVENGNKRFIFAWHQYEALSDKNIFAQMLDQLGYTDEVEPVIGWIRDVPYDGGGWVTVTWPHIYLDAPPNRIITHYSVWRQYQGSGWELMATVDAYYRDYYTYTSATLEDSSAAGTAYHLFKIIAHTANEHVYFESPPDSGYSVDNYGSEETFLAQNYPNPFNPQTTIEFGLKEPGHVRLAVYDAAGRLVRELVDQRRDANTYSEIWDGLDEQGRAVASGVYFYRLKAGAFEQTHKMILVQ
jgi:hypothetical protein